MVFLVALLAVPIGFLFITAFKAVISVWLLILETLLLISTILGLFIHCHPRRSINWVITRHRKIVYIVWKLIIDLDPYSYWMETCVKGMARFREIGMEEES